MDGDHTAKTLEQGANAATKAQDLTEGVHEGATQAVCFPKLPMLSSLHYEPTCLGAFPHFVPENIPTHIHIPPPFLSPYVLTKPYPYLRPYHR